MVKYKIMKITILSSFFLIVTNLHDFTFFCEIFKKNILGFFCPYTEWELMLFVNKKSSTEETKRM